MYGGIAVDLVTCKFACKMIVPRKFLHVELVMDTYHIL